MENTYLGFEFVAKKALKNLTFIPAKSNRARILVVLRETDYQKEEEILLRKIIKATSCDFDEQISLLILKENEGLFLNDILREIGIDEVICFGINEKTLALNLKAENFEIIKLSGQKFLFSVSLNKLLSDGNAKKMLWASLKTFFELD